MISGNQINTNPTRLQRRRKGADNRAAQCHRKFSEFAWKLFCAWRLTLCWYDPKDNPKFCEKQTD